MVRMERFGVFVEVAPGKDGLVHQSELDLKSVRNVSESFSVGDVMDVMLLEIQETGKLSLSRCALTASKQLFKSFWRKVKLHVWVILLQGRADRAPNSRGKSFETRLSVRMHHLN